MKLTDIAKRYSKVLEKLAPLKTKVDALEDDAKKLKSQLMAVMEASGIDGFKYNGQSFGLVNDFSVSFTDKQAFIEWLKTNNLFDKLANVTVTQATSLYKSELEKAVIDGNALDFDIPGIKPGGDFKKLSIKKV